MLMADDVEAPYHGLVEQMQEGALVLTSRGDILYANTCFVALVGEPLDAIVGSRVHRFVSLSERDDFETLLSVGSGKLRSSVIGPDADPVEVTLSLVTTAASGGERLTLIVTDLREILEASDERDRAERDGRRKDEFIATLAHELRSPLDAIHHAVRVLELAHAAEITTKAHEVITRQVGQMSHLIDDLFDVERVISGRILLDRQVLDLADVVHRAVAVFAVDASLNRRIEISTEPVWIDGDAGRLEQVLTNVVANAIKFTPPDGRVRVALCADGGDAALSVEDTGCGISLRLLPVIFDMYVQAERTLDSAHGGLGIGLTLARRLVELHGGTIVASSPGEGQGSRFTIRLRQIPSAERPVGLSLLPERRSAQKRVLLIDVSKSVRQALRLRLQFAGHLVYDAADGVDGLELLKTVHPDVGVVGLDLPGLDGYQVATRIREEPHGRRMLLLALSAAGVPDASKRSFEYGFDGHLVKPVDPDYLVRIIAEIAERS
jgi:signal transduction histidine kinase